MTEWGLEHLCLSCLLKPGSLHYYHCQGLQGSELALQPFLIAYLSVCSLVPPVPPVPPMVLCPHDLHASHAPMSPMPPVPHEGIQTPCPPSPSLCGFRTWVWGSSQALPSLFCSVDFVSSAPQPIPALPLHHTFPPLPDNILSLLRTA